MYDFKQIFDQKNNVLFVTAHPDDVIVYFSGLIIELVKENKNVFVLAVTNGARGSNDNTVTVEELGEIRIQEEKNALATMNVPYSHFECLNYLDGEVESNYTLIQKIIVYISKWNIDVVCTHDPSMQYITTYGNTGYFVQHRDHRKVGEAVIDAVYPFSRHKSFYPVHDGDFTPREVYDVLLTDENSYNFEIDMTELTDLKLKALMEYKSQVDEEKAKEIIAAFEDKGRNYERFNYLKLMW
jgi:LmbE family N-acetylglucosaminyl deacetylase